MLVVVGSLLVVALIVCRILSFLIVICVSCLPVLLSFLFLTALWERADHLTLLYVMVSYVSVIFKFGVMGQVWYVIVSNPLTPSLLCNHLAEAESWLIYLNYILAVVQVSMFSVP